MRRPAFALLALLVPACANETDGDVPATPVVGDIKDGERIRDISNPDAPTHADNNSQITVRGATVIAVDNFDETKNGKSRGTIYVQDLAANEPYSGISLYQPSFVPGNLKVGVGDVLDFTGVYQENTGIGTAKFDPGQVLPQLATPVGTFRYEFRAPPPRVIPVDDLRTYDKGRRWIGMLVTVKDVTVGTYRADSAGRVSAPIVAGDARGLPTVTNELSELPEAAFPPGTKIKSLTGVVTYFFSLHIAPRSPADLVK